VLPAAVYAEEVAITGTVTISRLADVMHVVANAKSVCINGFVRDFTWDAMAAAFQVSTGAANSRIRTGRPKAI
jgi:hypothetical protein